MVPDDVLAIHVIENIDQEATVFVISEKTQVEYDTGQQQEAIPGVLFILLL